MLEAFLEFCTRGGNSRMRCSNPYTCAIKDARLYITAALSFVKDHSCSASMLYAVVAYMQYKVGLNDYRPT
eukprot:110341-Amphidinium_carterae.1